MPSDGQRGNQRQVSLVAHRPWKSQSAISTCPPTRRRVEKWKTNNRFSTFPLAIFLSQHQTQERRPLAALRFARAFRLILHEKMLELRGSVLLLGRYPAIEAAVKPIHLN